MATVWRPAIKMTRCWMLRVVGRLRSFPDMEVMLLPQHCLWPREPETCRRARAGTAQLVKWIRAAVGQRGALESAGAQLPRPRLRQKWWTLWLWSPDFDDSEPDFDTDESEYLSLSRLSSSVSSTTDHLSWSHHSLATLEWEVLTLFAQTMACAGGKVKWIVLRCSVSLEWCSHALCFGVSSHCGVWVSCCGGASEEASLSLPASLAQPQC